MTIKIATWNINSLKVRLPHVLDWLSTQQPDILALQETKLVDDSFPKDEIAAAGYQVIFSGQKTYNGVAILSKQIATSVVTDIANLDDPARRILAATFGDLRVINLYVPNGEAVESPKYQYKLNWLEKVTEFLTEQLKQHEKLVVLGDFNIAPTDLDVKDPENWRDKVLCSEPERAVFQTWLNLGLKDSFRLFQQPEKSFTWWDYRMLAFRRNLGLRIDHILISEALAKVCQRCEIDKEQRRLERPSDHAPVWCEFR